MSDNQQAQAHELEKESGATQIVAIENEMRNNAIDTQAKEQKKKNYEFQSLKDNTIKTNQTTSNIFDQLFLDYPKNLPTEPFDFNPPNPKKIFHSMILSTSHLAKRIYLEMLRAINGYSQLLKIAPEKDKKTIENLQNQMEILSIAMLNVYGKLGEGQRVPFLNSNRPPLSTNYKTALQEMYDRVFHIHNLVLRLIGRTGDEFRSTLVIVLTNLKSQLKTLKQLQD